MEAARQTVTIILVVFPLTLGMGVCIGIAWARRAYKKCHVCKRELECIGCHIRNNVWDGSVPEV